MVVHAQILFKDHLKNEISLNKLKGKYTYINFFASWNKQSLHEMEVVKQFQKNMILSIFSLLI